MSRRNRRALDPSSLPAGTAAVATPTINATKARLTFDVPVIVNGIPTAITCNAAAPTAVTVVSPTIVDLTYGVAVAAGQTLLIPAGVSEIRTSTGGFVAAATKTF